MTVPDYRVVVEVGAHTFEATYPTTPPGNAVTLPLSFGWQIPERTDFFPTQRNPLSGSFGLVVEEVADVADLAVGDRVVVEVYVPNDDVDPWQRVVGVVTQLDATLGTPNRVTVYFTDETWLLSEITVGAVDWPEESVGDRIERICTEAGITIDDVHNESQLGLLAQRDARATNALSAIRDALKDDADRNISWSGLPNPTYGRTVYNYVPNFEPDPIFEPGVFVPTLFLRVFERRVTSWPAELEADGGLGGREAVTANILDGNACQRAGKWTRAAEDRPTFVIVDSLTVAGDPGAPGAVPYLRNTSYVDGPGPSFPSSTARTFLARSLVPDDSIADRRGWRTDSLRHLSYLDPEGVRGWIGDPTDLDDTGLSWARLRPTIVSPVEAGQTLDGRTWIAGLLSGARLTIPPGGKFFIDFSLRPDVLAHVPTTPEAATTYSDWETMAGALALTWAQINPAMTYRDLRLLGA